MLLMTFIGYSLYLVNTFVRWFNSVFREVSLEQMVKARFTKLLMVAFFHMLGACAFQLRYTSVWVGLR